MKFVTGSVIEKNCPKCQFRVRRLVIRENRHTGHQFLGCQEWPDCDYTEEISESMKMEMLGAIKLPGFD